MYLANDGHHEDKKYFTPGVRSEEENPIASNIIIKGKENIITDKKFFIAERILAKHDENYMPKEVADALKKSGDWTDI